MTNTSTTDTPRTDAEWASTWQSERRLHELCLQLERELAHSLANQVKSQAEVESLRVIGEIAREQQETIKKLIAEIGTVRLELVAAQESEAVWKTELDKADQRRLEAEAEVERLKKLCEMALESAEDAVEERDLKRRIADDICSLRKDLNK